MIQPRWPTLQGAAQCLPPAFFPAGHVAVVRPFAQTSRATVLARGPRVAQASTVNSPSTDMNLAVKKVREHANMQAACCVCEGHLCAHGRGTSEWQAVLLLCTLSSPALPLCPVCRTTFMRCSIELRLHPKLPPHGACPPLVGMPPLALSGTLWMVPLEAGWTSSNSSTALRASRAGWWPPAACLPPLVGRPASSWPPIGTASPSAPAPSRWAFCAAGQSHAGLVRCPQGRRMVAALI